MDDFDGQGYEVVEYRDLPVPYQLDTAWFMPGDGNAWSDEPLLGVTGKRAVKDRLIERLPWYSAVYARTR